tara:strand:+ start:2543 stop:3166 length:624 start_codon:yes stop_codon:yes gene_type:complete
MALVKYNNNSISAITTAGQLASGNMVLIKEQTASSSSTISFVHGSSDVVLDSTYPIYIFKFINMHPASDSVDFQFNLSIDAGSNYNVTKTTTFFRAFNFEDNSAQAVQYQTGEDLAQGTGFQSLSDRIGNDADASCSGTLHLFNPSSTTFVKHFMSRFNRMFSDPVTADDFMAGYGNTTSDVDAIQFKFSSGNIDSGTIKLFGIKDS